MLNKRQYKYSNSGAIAASAYWYPFTENPPTDNEITLHWPLQSFIVENKSSQGITVILDPIAGTSSKEFFVPNGNTLSLDNQEEVSFYQIAIKNDGGLEIAIDEIKVSVRNY